MIVKTATGDVDLSVPENVRRGMVFESDRCLIVWRPGECSLRVLAREIGDGFWRFLGCDPSVATRGDCERFGLAPLADAGAHGFARTREGFAVDLERAEAIHRSGLLQFAEVALGLDGVNGWTQVAETGFCGVAPTAVFHARLRIYDPHGDVLVDDSLTATGNVLSGRVQILMTGTADTWSLDAGAVALVSRRKVGDGLGLNSLALGSGNWIDIPRLVLNAWEASDAPSWTTFDVSTHKVQDRGIGTPSMPALKASESITAQWADNKPSERLIPGTRAAVPPTVDLTPQATALRSALAGIESLTWSAAEKRALRDAAHAVCEMVEATDGKAPAALRGPVTETLAALASAAHAGPAVIGEAVKARDAARAAMVRR